jgi:thymidine kinase
MDLTLILGPMKSGKSFELISRFSPLQYSDVKYGLYQSDRNVRDAGIASRGGTTITATKIPTLAVLLDNDDEMVGIDEVHMFPPEEADVVAALLGRGTQVFASGLDMDYRGRMFDVVKRLLELGPHDVYYRRAVCEVCRRPHATHTQVFRNGQPLVEGVPSVIPEDGTYEYKPVCRACFVQKSLFYPLPGASEEPFGAAEEPEPLEPDADEEALVEAEQAALLEA